jgi:TIR domain
MDVDAMKPGMDFVKQLDTQVSQCQVLLAVIGRHWVDAKDHDGQSRLDSDNDYVRIELASALRRDIPVIPVLVDGAAMPSEDSLPDDLKPLVRRHALELRHTRFNADADAIMHALEQLAPPRRFPWQLIVVGTVVAVGVAGVAVFWPSLTSMLQPVGPPATVMEKPEAQTRSVATTKNASPPAAAVTKNPSSPTAAVSAPGRSEDLRVTFGDTIDQVKAAYSISANPEGASRSPHRQRSAAWIAHRCAF